MIHYNSKIVGWLARTIGILIILSVVLLFIFFAGYVQELPAFYSFGTVNDITNAIVATLTAVLATILLPSPRKKSFWFVVLLLLAAAAWVGAVIVTIDSLDAGGIISNLTRQRLRIEFGLGFIASENLHFGYGLIGLWILGVNLFALQNNRWPSTLCYFGIFASVFNIIGLAGIPEFFGSSTLFPIWCFWLGKSIFSEQSNQHQAATTD